MVAAERPAAIHHSLTQEEEEEGGRGGFDLDWLLSTHTNNKRAIFRPGEEEEEEEKEKRRHLGK